MFMQIIVDVQISQMSKFTPLTRFGSIWQTCFVAAMLMADFKKASEFSVWSFHAGKKVNTHNEQLRFLGHRSF